MSDTVKTHVTKSHKQGKKNRKWGRNRRRYAVKGPQKSHGPHTGSNSQVRHFSTPEPIQTDIRYNSHELILSWRMFTHLDPDFLERG